MKFAKTYISTLASSSFPEEWKRGAVDYKQLKKLINGVVQELEDIGLGADVLKDLLVPPAEEVSDHHLPLITDDIEDDQETPAEKWIDTLPPSASSRRHRTRTASAASSEHDDSPHESASSDDHTHLRPPSDGGKKRRRRRSKTPTDLLREHDTLMKRAHSASSHASSSGGSASGRSVFGSSSDSGGRAPSIAASDWAKPKKAFHTGEDGKSHMDSEGRRWLNGKEGRRARAEYDLGGTPEHPIPRIRLFIESPVGSDDEDDYEDDDDTDFSGSHDDGDDEYEHDDYDDDYNAPQQPQQTPSQPFSTFTSSPSAQSATGTVTSATADDSPITLRGRRPTDSPASVFTTTGRTPVLTTAGVVADEMALADAAADAEEAGKLEALPEAALNSLLHPDHAYGDRRGRGSDRRGGGGRRRRHLSPSTGRRYRRREIVIPLTADTEFLERLTGALQSLSRIQEQQREQFVAATENLCSSIARVASPYATPTDMYVWREIFALWVDSQIFESSREKDRGELSVEESEARLKKFAEELAKRGWIARGANVTEDEEEVAAVEAEQSGAGAAGAGTKKKGGGAGLFRLPGHPHSGNGTSNGNGKSPDTINLPDGTVYHVSHDTRTASALDDFLKLNVELLDVKKFQAVNVEAARKILKKHDKRTALTAASDLRAFMAMQERERETLARLTSGAGGNGEVWSGGAERLNLMEINGGIAPAPLRDAPHALPLAKFDSLSLSSPAATSSSRELTTTHPSLAALLPTSATGLMGGSLPHILLSLFTTTLLPILPSIDESSCVICTSVAWRPVRLQCGHLFCIRCLVKLQRQHRDDCPLCRSPMAVKNANGSNLDAAMGNLLKTYFPEEVAEKARENDREVQAEEEKEMGLEKTHCVIC
ncbi:hypothetical protein CF326_g4879 [Tilletia indica]|nr:hypothetical protein CF326_g4879 [Tilletia indica]